MENRLQAQPQIKRYILSKSAQKKVPVSGTFELTPRCNFNCRMCYIHMTKDEMERTGQQEYTAKDWIELGKVAVEKGMLFLLLTGGEPFIREDFFEIYEALRNMGLLITINSNGYCINEDVVKRLAKNPPTQIHITLYGGSNDTYERLCGIKNGFDVVTKNIIALKEAGIMVDLNASFTQYNVDDMEAIYAFANEHNLNVRATSYMFPPVRNDHDVDVEVRFTAKAAGEARAKFTRCGHEEAECKWIVEQIKQGKELNLLDEDDCSILRDEDLEMHCMAGRGSFWVTWDGRITPCGMMNTPVASLHETDFDTAWKHICEETVKIHLPAECVACKDKKYCQMCGALTIAEGHGDSTKKPEYLCEMTHTFIEKLCNEDM